MNHPHELPRSAPPATGDWSVRPGTAPAERPTLPGYEILEEIGRGGMGVVYKARQPSSGRLIALKMIRDGALASTQQLARFRIEAEAAARMRHRNIVQIEEIGEHQGRPYFVMELVEGGRLDQHLAGRPQPAALSAQLLRTLARAVQHAHEQQIVHRDLKPANILLEAGNTTPLLSAIPKITDFGLAKRLDTESTAWTPEGAVVGTPTYMAPEQAAGRVQEIGPGVDIYALGVILYEMLTGRPPFQADSWTRALEQVLHDEPVPPSRLQSDVPPDLETVCLKCLEKDPKRRYASAGELADDLECFLASKPIAALPLGETERLARLAARDGYRIIGEVGRGPRSIVYHAQHEQLKQPVALKIFAAGVCSREEWETRLQHDAEMGAGITHPQIVPIHRTGWWDGAPYVALEYVPQGSLAARLTGRPHSIRQSLGLVEQLAEIVGYLHRQGVVHGNLKPSNVLLAANGIPRLADFQLTGGLYLSPMPADDQPPEGLCYLTPEIAANSGAEPRPYTDVYGLGIILYEMLSGRQPFIGADARDVLEQVRTQDPVPPSAFNAEITAQVDRTCLRCVQKNHWQRYTRAYDLSMCLRRLVEEL